MKTDKKNSRMFFDWCHRGHNILDGLNDLNFLTRKNVVNNRKLDRNRLHGEDGFITIVIVLMMLVMVTIIGVSSINMSSIEASIVRSDALYKRNFYMAESAAYEAAQRIENAEISETDIDGELPWIIEDDTADLTDWKQWRNDKSTTDDFTDDEWIAGASVRSNVFFTEDPGANPSNLNVLLPPAEHVGDVLRLSAHYRGVAGGSSLKVTNEEGRLYAFNVYGFFSDLNKGQGQVLIEMGYRKRF